MRRESNTYIVAALLTQGVHWDFVETSNGRVFFNYSNKNESLIEKHFAGALPCSTFDYAGALQTVRREIFEHKK